MEISTVSTLIGSYGFPILACIGMAWYVKYQTDKYKEEMTEIRKEHKEETKEMTDTIKEITAQHKADIERVTEALNNNTIAVQRLCDKLQ